jgi:TetR/AcrR family transcriptional regulator
VLDGGRNLEKFWLDSRMRTQEKVNVINGWIARGLMLPVDPYVLLMSIWSVTQFYADSAVQVRQLIKPGEDDWQPDREALVKQLTTLLLRGCGIQTP